MLVVGRQDWELVSKDFEKLGFNRAYPPNTLPEMALEDLRADVTEQRQQTKVKDGSPSAPKETGSN